MKLKKLLAVAITAAFALPFAAQASADSDRIILAQAGGPSGASSVGTGPTGGTNSPQSAGEPKAAVGDRTKHCQGMTGAERDKCMRDARSPADSSSGASSSGGASSSSGATVTPGGTGSTGTTAGPGSSSNRTAPSSDTATSPSTSGEGKAK
jgi:hypothetical protein